MPKATPSKFKFIEAHKSEAALLRRIARLLEPVDTLTALAVVERVRDELKALAEDNIPATMDD